MPTRTTALRPILLATLAAAALLAGCSSSGGVSTTSTTAGTTPPASTPGRDAAGADGTTPGTRPASSTSTTQAGSTTTSGPSGPTTSTAGGPTTTGAPPVTASPSNKAFCDRLAQAEQEFAELNYDVADSQVLAKMKQTFQDLVSLAPGPIRADIEKANGAIQGMTSANDVDTLDTPEMLEVTERLEAWTDANCPKPTTTTADLDR